MWTVCLVLAVQFGGVLWPLVTTETTDGNEDLETWEDVVEACSVVVEWVLLAQNLLDLLDLG